MLFNNWRHSAFSNRLLVILVDSTVGQIQTERNIQSEIFRVGDIWTNKESMILMIDSSRLECKLPFLRQDTLLNFKSIVRLIIRFSFYRSIQRWKKESRVCERNWMDKKLKDLYGRDPGRLLNLYHSRGTFCETH